MKLIHIAAAMPLAFLAACQDRPSPTVAPEAAKPDRLAVQDDSAPANELVSTPNGLYHRSCVHEVPSGSRISISRRVTRPDGSAFDLPTCRFPGIRDKRGKRIDQHSAERNLLPGARASNDLFPTLNDWIEDARDSLTSGAYDALTADWSIPNTPLGSYSSGQVYYTFPGMVSAGPSATRYIIQPVVSYGYAGNYGGQFWRGASWRCNRANDCLHSTPISLTAGDEMLGTIDASSCSGGHCTWTIITRDLTKQTQSTYVVTDTAAYVNSYGGAVEVYGLTQCSQLPSYGVGYTGITLTNQSGASVTPHWHKVLQASPSPDCQFSVDTTSSTVYLHHNPPPPPALAATIGGSWLVPANTFCSWPAVVSGGTPPYSYTWYRDGSFVSPVSSYADDTGNNNFLLKLVVYDNKMPVPDTVTKQVTIEIGGGTC